jgi:hypothetical protein
MPARLRRIAQNLALVVAGLAAAAVLAEVLVRIFAPQVGVGWTPYQFEAYRGIYRLDPALGYELLPSIGPREVLNPEFRYTFATNRDGLRDRDFGAKGNAYRIVVLGDSFTFGFGVDHPQTYVKRLERRLQERYRPRPIEVVNGGVNGYGTAHQYFLLERKLLRYEPDLVLVGFVANDTIENGTYETQRYAIDERGYLTDVTAGAAADERWQGTLPIPFKSWLRRHSHAYYLAINRYHTLKVALGLLPGNVESRQLGLYTATMSAEVAGWWERTRYWLGKLQGVLEERRTPLLVVFIPANFQVDPAKWNGARRFYRLSDAEAALDRPQEELRAICRDAGVGYLDLLPALRAREHPDRPLYYHEGHWTAEGHRVAAELIFARIVAERLIPEPAAR